MGYRGAKCHYLRFVVSVLPWSQGCECSLCLVEARIKERGLLVTMASWRALLPACPCCRKSPRHCLSKTSVTAVRQESFLESSVV